MQKFITQLVLFMVPLALYFGTITFLLNSSGELLPLETLVQAHEQRGKIIGLAYSDPIKQIKLSTLKKRRPKIIALGTSRVMQFRSFFFNSPNEFYNAGGIISKIKDLNAFLTAIHPYTPEVIILGLDHNFFNANWDNLTGPPTLNRKDTSFIKRLQSQHFLSDLIKNKIAIDLLFASPNIGLNGKTHNQGLRSDGSYLYGQIIKAPDQAEDHNFTDTYDRIKKGNRRFEYGEQVNKTAVLSLDTFLRNCRKKNIHVVGFLPPYAHEVWLRLKSMPHLYAYMFSLQKELSPVFESTGFKLFDFSDIAQLGASEHETIDGFHGSEVAYLRLLIKLEETSIHLTPHVSKKALMSLLDNSFSSTEIHQEIF